MDTANDMVEAFENLKISAFTKYSTLNKDELSEVTIGPNRTIKYGSNYEDTQDSYSEETPLTTTESREQAVQGSHTINKEDNGLPMREIIKDIENERINNVQNLMRHHLEKFQKHSELLENNRKQKWLNQQAKLIHNMQQQEQRILEALKEDDVNKLRERQKLFKHYQNLAEQRKKNVAALAAKEKEQKELNIHIENIKKMHGEFTTLYMDVLNSMKTCSDDFKKPITVQLKTLFTNMEEIVAKCKSLKIDMSDVKVAQDVVQKIKSFREQVITMINDMKNKEQETQKAVQEQLKSKQPETILSENFKDSHKTISQSSMDQNIKADKLVSSKLDKYISRENLGIYTEVMDFMEKYVQSFKELADNQSLKQFKFDCKKAVNIPVNAISAVNSQHLRDKYERLSNLLMGKVVRIGENAQFSAASHPQGVAYCTDLLAKKMVLQGDLMISSNPEAAFCYASIIISLWNTIPDFGKLLLAYFYKSSPYLVPFNIPKSVDQSDEEFYKSQGYQYVDGHIEKQDKYLKRMTGIMRLYAAILISKPKYEQKTHPHGIENGWRWLASILKLEPRIDITATMIHTFLEVAGYHMEITYKKPFQKLLQIITVKFLPVMKQNDSGGPVTRLEVLLQEYQKKRKFEKPDGILPENFW